jgi:hypothetical protein
MRTLYSLVDSDQASKQLCRMKTPKAVSPKAMGISEDARVLGVYCFELAITKGG